MTPTLVGRYPRRQGSGKLLGGGSTIGEWYEIDAEILAHYEVVMEKERLLGGGVRLLEYLRTRELLARHLPPAAATILDVGGGAGAHALPLAKEGYSVYLVDPVPLHVEQATAASVAQPEAPLVGVEVGDALPPYLARRSHPGPPRSLASGSPRRRSGSSGDLTFRLHHRWATSRLLI